MLVIKLAKQCRSSLDPVFSGYVGVEQDGQYVVGRVTSGGQLTTSLAGLVQWTLVASGRRIDLRPASRLKPDDWHRIVEDSMMLLFQQSAIHQQQKHTHRHRLCRRECRPTDGSFEQSVTHTFASSLQLLRNQLKNNLFIKSFLAVVIN